MLIAIVVYKIDMRKIFAQCDAIAIAIYLAFLRPLRYYRLYIL
jgi:hypothetical protein